MTRILIGLLIIPLLISCGAGGENQKSAAPAPVRAARVERGNMTRALRAVGTIAASASVAITPRVDGEIVAVNFIEGDDVSAGESILEIDPRPYRAELEQKRANLAKSRAQLEKARHDRARYGRLVKDGYISGETYDQFVTDEAALAATVESDLAALHRAELELSFCSISAPISGRIGELRLHKGNMAKSNSAAPVCSIDAISPCYATFSVPEAHLAAILDYLARGSVKISATPIGGAPVEGTLTLVGNSVDAKTGSIPLRGSFPNADKRLWPGQFAEISLPLGELTDKMIVPSRAIQTGRDQSHVYVIGKDNKAERRNVRILLERDGQSAVEGDLRPDEKVITDGLMRVTNGTSVRELE